MALNLPVFSLPSTHDDDDVSSICSDESIGDACIDMAEHVPISHMTVRIPTCFGGIDGELTRGRSLASSAPLVFEMAGPSG